MIADVAALLPGEPTISPVASCAAVIAAVTVIVAGVDCTPNFASLTLPSPT